MRILYIPKPVSAFAAVKYGLLYNFYAAIDARNICSAGWHVSSNAEFNTLRTYLGGASSGVKLKEVGLTYWGTPNTASTNEVGWNGRGAGYRLQGTGTFSILNRDQILWTNAQLNSTLAYYHCHLNYNTSLFDNGSIAKTRGFSIRPMKDSTTLTNGQTGTYTDPSGFVYPTICIGTQEWVAMNIKTQHYRNGDPIVEVIDNAAWAALTTGALCAYNNDWGNV